MKIGKLYQAKKYYWFLYPSKDIAAATVAFGPATAHRPGAKWWSSYYKCNVSYLEPKSVFCLIEQDGELYKILTDDGILGWIYIPQQRLMYVIEEVNQ